MKLLLTLIAATAFSTPVLAAGCLKGAAVGGVAGHYVGKGHAVAGAAIGCAVGHHRAAVARKQAAAPAPQGRGDARGSAR